MSLSLGPNGLLNAENDAAVFDDGGMALGRAWTPSGFGYYDHDQTDSNAGTHGWVGLGGTQGSQSQSYGTRYYKIWDYGTNAPSNEDVTYLIFYNGDSNHANGGLYHLHLNFWSSGQRTTAMASTTLQGEPCGVLYLLDTTDGAEQVWIRGTRSWGSLYIKRVGGEAGPIQNTDRCAWFNDGPLATTTGSQPSNITKRVRGSCFMFDIENNNFEHGAVGETW